MMRPNVLPIEQNRSLAEQEFLKSAVASRETRRHWKCREEAIPRYVHTLLRKLEEMYEVENPSRGAARPVCYGWSNGPKSRTVPFGKRKL
jgi:hypothetical protein